jgi:hypothetical protein
MSIEGTGVSLDATTLAQLEQILAQHPFGNSDYITGQLHVCYKRRLERLSKNLPAAATLLHTISQIDPYRQYRVIGDVVVRCAVQHALRQVELGEYYGLPLHQCEEIFQATVRLLEEGECAPLGSRLTNWLGTAPFHRWVWSEERPDDVFAHAFRYLVSDNFGDPLCTPNAEELAMLSKGEQLLRKLLPLLSHSALTHVHLIAVYPPVGSWIGEASSSEFRLSGVFFLSRRSLSNPFQVAEAIFHEALHHQMYDFRHGHSLLKPDFGRADAPRIHSLWNLPDGNHWDAHRALAAFHVYVHLSLLCTVAELRLQELEDAYGKLYSTTGRRKALARANYLGEQIRARCWDELGPAGKQFVDWFASALEVLDPSPPPRDAYVHLLLDRYRRESKKVELILNEPEQASNLSKPLIKLAKDEIDSARRVLSLVNAEAALARLARGLEQISDHDLGSQFPRVRLLICEAILGVSQDGYTLPTFSEARVADETVRQMVERSSEKLKVILAA